MIDYVNSNGKTIAVAKDIKILNTADALDLIAEASYSGCDSIVVSKESFPESFYSLKTGFAGEILQKFSNYRMKLAIVGDFSSIKSNSLSAFIYESNKGNRIFFKSTFDEAAKALTDI